MERFSASAQHDNLKGQIAIDDQDLTNLYNFAKANAINTERYIPVGITFWKSPNDAEPMAQLITVDAEVMSQDESAKNVAMFIEKNDPVPVRRFELNVGISEFFKYCDKVSMTVTRFDNLTGKELNNLV